jgi:hypothetical protein
MVWVGSAVVGLCFFGSGECVMVFSGTLVGIQGFLDWLSGWRVHCDE